MKKAASKYFWILLLLMLAGIVLGSFVGTLTQNISGFSWLSYGQSFGLSSPIVLDLGILVLTFGLTIHISIASIMGLLLAAIIFHFI